MENDPTDQNLPDPGAGFKRWRSPSLDEAMEQILIHNPDSFSLTDLGRAIDVERNLRFGENDYQSHRRVSLHHHQPLHKLHPRHKRHAHKPDHDFKPSPDTISKDQPIPEETLPQKSESEEKDEADKDVTFFIGSTCSITNTLQSTPKTIHPPPKKSFSDKFSSAFQSVKSPLKSVLKKTKEKEPKPAIMLSPSHTMPSCTGTESLTPLLTISATDSSMVSPSSSTSVIPIEKPEEIAQEKMKVTFVVSEKDDGPKKTASPVPPPAKKTHHKQKKHYGMEALLKRQHQGSDKQLKSFSDAVEPEEAELLKVVDIEDVASHRFDDTKGMRRHKILNKTLVSSASLTDKRNGSDVTAISLSKKREFDHEPHEIFVELNELITDEQTNELIWRETARWIKYEEDIEVGGGRWGKPHVSSLSFHSLLQLNYYLTSGIVILDLEQTEYLGIAQTIADEFVNSDQIKPEQRSRVLSKLLLRHRHAIDKSGGSFLRRGSAINFSVLGQEKRSPGYLRATRNKTDSDFNHALNSPNSVPGPETAILLPNSLPVTMTSPNMKHSISCDENLKASATILRRVPVNAEGVTVLVGALDILDRPAVAFVRLAKGELIPHLLEIPIPVRFFFVFLGPPDSPDLDYHELGRSMSTLMCNRNFHDAAYLAMDRGDMLHAFNLFLDDSVVLPPGDMQKPSLIPLDEIRRKSVQYKKREIPKLTKEDTPKTPPFDPLRRSGRCFGGLINDIKNRYPWYLSDIKDGFNLQCIAATTFIYFAAVSGAIAFGGLLGDKTGQLVGVPETLITTCVAGIVFSLFACQPLIVLGTTGPVLLFDEILFQFSETHSMNFLRLRVWVGLWTAIIATILVAYDGSSLVRYFSRFMQEIYATIISMLFIQESIIKIYQVFVDNPLQAHYDFPTDIDTSNSSLSNSNSTVIMTPMPKPNTALLSLFLTVGTFYIAFFLRHFRNSKFLGRNARRALGDFGVPIAIATMVALDFAVHDVYTQKLNVPSGLSPSNPAERWWFISPWPITILEFVTAGVAGLLLFILLFLETQICEQIVNKKERKIIKGSGFHFDMMLVSYLSIVTSIVGGPWVCAATVRSISHVSSLTVMSKTHAPGEAPHIVDVKEQRVTNFCVSLLIGISVLMAPVLQKVPVAVLFGVFLYMGISALSGIQLFERFLLLFMPSKHHPDFPFVRKVRTVKMHMYTLIQLFCIALLYAVKSTPLAPGFPFGLLALVFIHAQVKRLFTPEEFKALDGEETDKTEDEPDFYDQIVA